MTINPRTVVRRGLLSTLVPAGSTAFVTQPTSGQTITLYNSLEEPVNAPMRYRRLFLGIYSSHVSATAGTDSGVIFDHSFDAGTNYDLQETYTLAATTGTVYNLHVRSPWFKLRYKNSANTLTAWRFVLWGDESSAEPGV